MEDLAKDLRHCRIVIDSLVKTLKAADDLIRRSRWPHRSARLSMGRKIANARRIAYTALGGLDERLAPKLMEASDAPASDT